MDRSSSKSVLTKEVLAPGREQTGLAVLLVAASALAFALAGSAFALWARSAHHCPHHHATPTAVTVDAEIAEPTPVVITGECGPQFEQTGENVDVTFRTCPSSDVVVQPANEVVIEEQEGVMVLRIVD